MASFVVSKPVDSFDALLERAARQLPLNSPADVTAMRDLLSKVVSNVLQAPFDSKYRTLKLQNRTLRLKLFDKPGAKEVMSVLGFKRVILEDTRESAMFLAFDADEEETRKTVTAATESETSALAASEDASTSTSAAALAEAWAWLNKQLDACLLMRGAAKPQATCCAECTLQVRLPTGASFKLAFFAAEPLSAVVDYLNLTCPLQPLRNLKKSTDAASSSSEYLGSSDMAIENSGDHRALDASWLLQQPHPPRTIFVEASDLSKSLESHGLLPRANLVAVAPAVDVASGGVSASGSSSSGGSMGSGVLTPAELLRRQAAASGAKLQDAHVANLARQREAEAKMRQNKARAADSLKQERARLVADFAADRSDAKERREAKAAAAAAAATAEAAAAEAAAAEAVAASASNQPSASAAPSSQRGLL